MRRQFLVGNSFKVGTKRHRFRLSGLTPKTQRLSPPNISAIAAGVWCDGRQKEQRLRLGNLSWNQRCIGCHFRKAILISGNFLILISPPLDLQNLCSRSPIHIFALVGCFKPLNAHKLFFGSLEISMDKCGFTSFENS